MNLFQTVILISLVGNTGLGLFVLFSNPRRTVNLAFFILTVWIMLWLISMMSATVQHSYSGLMFAVRLTSAFAGVIPLGVFALHLAIVEPDISWKQIVFGLRYWVLATLGMALVCHSPFFITASSFATFEQSVPVSQYGMGFIIYLGFFTAVVVAMTYEFWKASRIFSGAQKTESQFVQLGCWLSFSSGLLLYGAAVIGNFQEVSRFLPLSVLIWDGFVAYGIATRRILSASAVLQRIVSYSLMAIYLMGLYIAAEWVTRWFLRWLVPDVDYLAHLLAALAVAFSVSPAHGWMQTVANRLFATADPLNTGVLLERAGQVFREVSTEANLMANFSDLVCDAFGTTKALLLRADDEGGFRQVYPEAAGKPFQLWPGAALTTLLRRDREALTIDTLQRMRSSPAVEEALKTLKGTSMALATGSFMRTEMKAVLLLASKKTGRIYDLRDQRTLQLLCDQFAVALENANLYTAVQNGKIYNDILLDSLTSGIVAVDSDRRVTVFNQRAQGLTGLTESAVVGQPAGVLPAALGQALENILKTQGGFRDADHCLLRGTEAVPIRMSGAMFHSHTGRPLGALLAFDDMTVVRKMEEQIRRTDRLSSIGTLSAGMAHEIKNPLVTIKTFAQLLPEQHHDPEFRRTFFDLVGQEVIRIDAIVNRLLNFARPAPPALQPVSLHGVLENSLRLVEPQLYKNGISLQRRLEAVRDRIDADAEQLNQTFVNFFLNALQAMGQGGVLTVRTAIVPGAARGAAGAGADRIQVDVQDTGCGIAPENLAKIFDPFFTTKEHGVGLGLSVSHGIIQEHGGTIDVESEKGRGTVFRVQFPLRQEAGR